MEESLEALNNRIASWYTSLIAVLALCMFFGVFGNMIVLYIFGRKIKKFSSDLFIICLSVHDLMTCLIGIPTEIFDLRNPITFSSVAACKVLKGLEGASLMTSSLILLSVTFDRYKRICKFGRTMRKRTTKLFCVSSFVIGMVAAIPVFIVYGKEAVPLDALNSSGTACAVADEYRGSTAILVYYGVLFIYFACCVIIIVLAYSMIRYRINSTRASLYRRRNQYPLHRMFNVKYTVPKSSSSATESDFSRNSKADITIYSPPSKDTEGNITEEGDCNTCTNTPEGQVPPPDFGSDKHHRSNTTSTEINTTTVSVVPRRNRTIHARSNKTTIIFTYITLGFILSFLPFLVAEVVRAADKGLEKNLSKEMKVFFQFCLKSYFLSSVINPFIYGFSSPPFRNECKQILMRRQ